MRRLVLALCLLASPLSAQWWEAPDRWRERQAWIPASIDDEDWETWVWHGAATEALGWALGKATPMSFRRGRQVIAGLYIARELYGVLAQRNRRYGDAAMDALVPTAVAILQVRVRVRL